MKPSIISIKHRWPGIIPALLFTALGIALAYQASIGNPVTQNSHKEGLVTSSETIVWQKGDTVEILTDPWGVPHIFASTDEGAFFGAGYAAARDRFFQMCFSRMVMRGRSAEYLGNVTEAIDTDKRMRYSGYYRHAEEVVQNMDPSLLSLLNAYADGVNYYLGEPGATFDPLFETIGLPKEAWTAKDCIATWMRMGFFFGPYPFSKAQKLNEFEVLVDSVGFDEAVEIMDPPPILDEPAAVVLQSDVPQEVQDSIFQYARDHGLIDGRYTGLGDHHTPSFSHAWVVSGRRTTTRSAVLHSDPQTMVSRPPLWYEFHFSGETFNARGIGVPGSPGILIGFNGDVAWGATAIAMDQADLFRLTIDPADPHQYYYNSHWETMTVEPETILVKNGDPIPIAYKETVWGPVITPVLSDIYADGPWPMYRNDPKHSGYSPYRGPAAPTLTWSYTTRSALISSPAVGASGSLGDGTIYVGSVEGALYAIHIDGSSKWTVTTGGSVNSSPAVAPNKTIYLGSDDHRLYAIKPDGRLKWSYATGGAIYSSPVRWGDGTIFIGSDDHKLYAFRDMVDSAAVTWSYTTGGSITSTPAVDSDGTIYVGSADFKLYALNADGSLMWSFTTRGAVNSSPAVGEDSTIYVGSNDYHLYAIHRDGSLKWRYATGGPVTSSPAIGRDGTLYVGSSDGKLYAIDSDGTLTWSYRTGGSIVSSPAVGRDSTIYIGSRDNRLYAINRDGSLQWSYTTDGLVDASPALGYDGSVYIASGDHKIYTFGPGAGEAYAMKAIPLVEPEIDTFEGLLELIRAHTAEEAGAALEGWRLPSANIIFGDGDGTIGYWANGAVPLRSNLSPLGGKIAQYGDSSGYDWQDIIPHNILPHVFNPRRGFIASANHMPVGAWYPIPLGAGQGSRGHGSRSRRLYELLEGNGILHPVNILNVHFDPVQVVRRDIVTIGYHIRDSVGIDLSNAADSALDILKGWHDNGGKMIGSDTTVTCAHFIKTNFREPDAPMLTPIYGSSGNGLNLFLQTMLDSIESNPGFIPDSAEIAYIETALATGWNKARYWIGEVAEWPAWYDSTQLTVHIKLFDTLEPFDPLVPEDSVTAELFTCTDGGTILSQRGQSYSQFIDLSSGNAAIAATTNGGNDSLGATYPVPEELTGVDAALTLLPPGQSDRSEPHETDQLDLWVNGRFKRAPLSRAAVESLGVSIKILEY